jgi:hypothetical protein
MGTERIQRSMLVSSFNVMIASENFIPTTLSLVFRPALSKAVLPT